MPEKSKVTYGNKDIFYTVYRSNRKTLEIAVYPDLRVVLTAPLHTDNEVLQQRVTKRKRWILKQIRYFEQFLPRTSDRQYLSGETHFYLGKQYRLKIIESQEHKVLLKGGRIEVNCPLYNKIVISTMLNSWYRDHARNFIQKILERNFLYFEKKGYVKPNIVIKHMDNRWASMSKNGVLTVNPRVIRAPRSCIEYVVLHELCHLVVMGHDNDFFELLHSLLPDWSTRKDLLERTKI